MITLVLIPREIVDFRKKLNDDDDFLTTTGPFLTLLQVDVVERTWAQIVRVADARLLKEQKDKQTSRPATYR